MWCSLRLCEFSAALELQGECFAVVLPDMPPCSQMLGMAMRCLTPQAQAMQCHICMPDLDEGKLRLAGQGLTLTFFGVVLPTGLIVCFWHLDVSVSLLEILFVPVQCPLVHISCLSD